jgi:TolA-binding protein
MFDWLSTTQHKINAALVVALIIVLTGIGLLAYAHFSRAKADENVEAASMRALRATIADSVKQALIKPQIAKLERRIDSLGHVQTQLNIKSILNAKRNEALNKQLDSINGRLGIRPKF